MSCRSFRVFHFLNEFFGRTMTTPFGAIRILNTCAVPLVTLLPERCIGVIFITARAVLLVLPYAFSPFEAWEHCCWYWLVSASQPALQRDHKMSLMSWPLWEATVVVPPPFLWPLAVVTTVLPRGWWLITLCWWPPSWPRGASRAPQRISFL